MSHIQQISFRRLNQIADDLPSLDIDERIYQKDHILFKEGTSSPGLFYIEKGTVLLTQDAESGTHTVIRTAKADDFIGFLSLVRETNYASTARAIEESLISFIPKQVFKSALHDEKFAKWFIKILCDRIESIEDHIVDLKTKSVRQRIATVLVSFEKAYAETEKEEFPIISLMKKDIAGMVGITPETLSRKLGEFENEGLIELHIKGIKVIDRYKLLRISNIRD